jgi:hypothetical protein
MDPGRWGQIQAAFDALVELDPTARARRLETLGSSDPGLRAEVESLLSADAEVDSRLAEVESVFHSVATPADLLGLVGRTVSHFRILEALGAGGMGAVYHAEDTRLGRPVALKFLLPHFGLDASAKERFIREARSAAALDHPNLCTVHEVGEGEDGRLFITMTLYRGETLKARLAREGSLSVNDALAIAKQIAEGLSCAHAAGIVHRDLKPGNVMVLPDGTVKILDFGLAKARDQSFTSSNARLGTAAYMAPEQMRGAAVDGRADLWALGVVLYEMLTGKKPFAGEHEVAVAHAILHDEPVLPSVLRADVPGAVEDLVLMLLSKDATKRPATAQELMAYLVDTEINSSSRRRGLWPRWFTRRRMASLGVIAIIGVVGALAWTLILRRQPARPVPPGIMQFTFSGNARTPALSPDGQRLAYSTRQCGVEGDCTVDVIVQDMEGAGRATVAHGAAWVGDIQWTADGRYLVIKAAWPGSPKWGPFSVPSLGGTDPRYLGCCEGEIVGSTDTALVGERPGSDSGAWLRWVTIPDGVSHDSLLIRKEPGILAIMVVPMGGGDKMLVRAISDTEFHLAVLARGGQRLDSLRLNGRNMSIVQPTPDARGLLVGRVPESFADPGDGSAVPLDLVMYPISGDGRFDPRPDTIMRGLVSYQAGAMIMSIARNGTLTYTSGPTRYELWRLPRASSSALITGRRRLTAATGFLSGKISPDGRRVGILRSVVLRDIQLKQFSVMSSDSGPETPVGSPQDVDDWEWSRDGASVTLAVRKRDSLTMQGMDVPGGATRILGTLVEGESGPYAALPGGGLAMVNSGPRLRRLGIPGLSDSLLDVPSSFLGIAAICSSPDGRTVAVVGIDRTMDTLLISRVSLVDGHAERVATMVVGDPLHDPPVWLDDGSLIFPAKPSQTVEWYRVPATGGQPVHLAKAPWGSAKYSLSADGSRLLATVAIDIADVYAIRNFGTLLNR